MSYCLYETPCSCCGSTYSYCPSKSMMFPDVCNGRRFNEEALEMAGNQPNRIQITEGPNPLFIDTTNWTIVNEPVYSIWEDITEETNVPMDTLQTQAAKLDQIFDDVDAELADALVMFPSMNSAHEGFAVLAEEMDELWDEVRGKQGSRDVAAMRKEAVQVAAMAIRLALDVCDSERGQR